jgi:hypothetical protein
VLEIFAGPTMAQKHRITGSVGTLRSHASAESIEILHRFD